MKTIKFIVDKTIGILSVEPSIHVLSKQRQKNELAKDIEDFARECFNASRETCKDGLSYKHKSFDEYLKSKETTGAAM